MKMHLLNGGRLRMKKRIYVPDAAKDETIELPVMATLFRHSRGNVLFDTGCHPSVETDAEARWGGMARAMVPVAPPQSDVVSSLAKLNLAPDDIDIVINSHFHPDHCGCNEFFRKATFICHEAELAAARAEGAEKRGYLPTEWDHPMPINPVSGEFDVMDDGRLVTVPLPGHTPGSMGLQAGLDRAGEMFFVSDAVSLTRNLSNDEVPMNAWDTEQVLQSYDRVREFENRGATIVCGHDDRQWNILHQNGAAHD